MMIYRICKGCFLDELVRFSPQPWEFPFFFLNAHARRLAWNGARAPLELNGAL